MKRHKRCSISGSASEIEIPLLLSFLHLVGSEEEGTRCLAYGAKRTARKGAARSSPTTVSGGEFDWGGTSIKS